MTVTETDARVLVVAEGVCADDLVNDIRRQGLESYGVNTGTEALEVHEKFDMLLVDLKLPDVDGLAVCRSIREENDVPMIAFTDGRAELERVLSLQAGYDDCIVKPYGLRELMARIEAVLRRSRPQLGYAPQRKPVSHGPLRIDPARREIHLGDRPVDVTRKEFDLLQLLASRPKEVFSRKQLMADVWDYAGSHSMNAQESRTIDTHVNSLRRKLGASDWIVTIRGVGFRLGDLQEGT